MIIESANTISNLNIIFSLLHTQFNIQPIAMKRLGGYSNLNYCITDRENSQYFLRIARPNRSYESVCAEEHVLQGLAQQESTMVPVLFNLINKNPLLIRDKGAQQYIHLFSFVPGDIECLWWQPCGITKLKQLFIQLAVLHNEMLRIPALSGYSSKIFRCSLPAKPPSFCSSATIGTYVKHQWEIFYEKAGFIQQDMAKYFPWKKARYQWIHRDIHLENVLFDEKVLTAFLDFERVGWDACELDAILSAFRVCREGNCDGPFIYDRYRFKIAIDSYLQMNPSLDESFFDGYDEMWKPFFCLDQALVYLKNAFDGVWELKEDIGFLPCFNEVLQYKSK